jgi:hypothetical protein
VHRPLLFKRRRASSVAVRLRHAPGGSGGRQHVSALEALLPHELRVVLSLLQAAVAHI